MKKKVWPLFLLGAIIVLLSFVSVFALTTELKISLNGKKEIICEYGESYQEQGAVAIFANSIFGDIQAPLRIEAVRSAKIEELGEYKITYKTYFLWLTAKKDRTVKVVDTQAPVIELVTSPDSYTLPKHEYQEEGFRATDNHDGDVTQKVERKVTETEIIYTVTDSSGNKAEVRRAINYNDPVPPVITLNGEIEYKTTAGKEYVEQGYTATDNLDGDITAQVTVEGEIDIYTPGTYSLVYTVTDSYQNVAKAERTIIVEAVRQPDVVNPGNKIIYLTFDDGPHKYTNELLDILAKYNVKASFFVVYNSWSYIKICKRIVDEGHAIGVHSTTHKYKEIYASEEAFLADFYEMENTIYNLTGTKPTIFRFPGGSSNTISRFNEGIMTRLATLMTNMGYQYFDWNVESGDAGLTTDPDEVFRRVVSGVQEFNVSVVLQHDVKGYSVEAVEKIIIWGLNNGYTFLPLEPTSPVCHHLILN